MSKYGSLLKKVEVFERLAVVGNRKEFLKSLAQALPNGTVSFPDASIVDMLSRLGGAISNLGSQLQNNPELASAKNLADQLVHELSSYQSPTYVSSKEELDKLAGELGQFRTGVSTLVGLVDSAKTVTPDARNFSNMIKQEAGSIAQAVTSFYRNQGIPVAESQPAAQPAIEAPTAPAPKPTETAKRLARALIAKVDQLPEGQQRSAHLGVVEKGVKALQNIFKSLQNSKGIQDYFAKMEITKALQHAYSNLDYNDLATVKSLEGGRGVPDSPDSKI
jgi:hypothetical protein